MENIKQMRGIDYMLEKDGLGTDIANYVMTHKPATVDSYDITSKDLEIILQKKIEDTLKENNLNGSWWNVFDEKDHKCRNLLNTLNSLRSYGEIVAFYEELSNKVNAYILDEFTPLEERELS